MASSICCTCNSAHSRGILLTRPTIPGIWITADLESRVYVGWHPDQLLEPAGGFERSVCRLRLDRSTTELHRPMDCLKSYHFTRRLTHNVITLGGRIPRDRKSV